ncbi:hypothetical protein [Sphingobacterium sp.]|uniref:hypothetical protein n=1 Tax=Sphingobacterium sp. TaxID=341027 RepID=UPI0028AC6008|nr:hypothetical protein [Sphingobacterium sp.]
MDRLGEEDLVYKVVNNDGGVMQVAIITKQYIIITIYALALRSVNLQPVLKMLSPHLHYLNSIK